MIKLFSLLFVILSIPGAYAQKYKVKDDVVFLGKSSVGKISGTEWPKQTDLYLMGTDNAKVLHIKSAQFSLNNPFLNNSAWYAVKFEDTGKEIKIPLWSNCNAKCLLNKVLPEYGILFNGSAISDQDALIEKFDISEKIATDTLAIKEKYTAWMKVLKSETPARDKRKPVVLMRTSGEVSGGYSETTYTLGQDDVAIGKLIKTKTEIPNSITASYNVYRILTLPEGTHQEAPAATVAEVTKGDPHISVFTIVDGKWHQLSTQDASNMEKVLANYLAQNGYL